MSTAASQRPNIIFIVADDLGFADLGCYGGRDAQFGKVSPVIDQLAANGLKFTDGYANSPVCSPTRFALMTARYQYRLQPIPQQHNARTTHIAPDPALHTQSRGLPHRLDW